MARFIALLASGVAQGAVATLVALGVVLIFKATGVVNFAQGSLLTLGAYLGYWLMTQHKMTMALAYVIVLALMFVAGGVMERVAIAPIRRRPVIIVMIATYGMGLLIQALLGLQFGTQTHPVPSPVGSRIWRVAGAVIPDQNLLIIVVTVVVVVALFVVFSRSQVGRQVRALASDPETALLQGIRGPLLSLVTFGLSGVLAGIGGLLIAPQLSVYPNLGFGVMLNSFVAAILGGFERLEGVALASVVLSVIQVLLVGYVSAAYSAAYPFLILLLVLVVKPQGLVAAVTSERY